jgi:hypothetical protein
LATGALFVVGRVLWGFGGDTATAKTERGKEESASVLKKRSKKLLI